MSNIDLAILRYARLEGFLWGLLAAFLIYTLTEGIR